MNEKRSSGLDMIKGLALTFFFASYLYLKMVKIILLVCQTKQVPFSKHGTYSSHLVQHGNEAKMFFRP